MRIGITPTRTYVFAIKHKIKYNTFWLLWRTMSVRVGSVTTFMGLQVSQHLEVTATIFNFPLRELYHCNLYLQGKFCLIFYRHFCRILRRKNQYNAGISIENIESVIYGISIMAIMQR